MNYKATIVIGLGFFTMGLMDPLYDTYVPVFLDRFVGSRTLVGTLMTIDNLMALLLIPVVTAWSDAVRTPIGRRIPFIVTLLPLSAVGFAFLPYAASTSLTLFVVALVGFNLFKQSARGPVVALMPDTVPNEYRSEANGVINMMAGVAAVVGTLVLAPMMDVRLVLPIVGDLSRRVPFLISALLIVVAAVVVGIGVRERTYDENVPRRTIAGALRTVFGSQERSALWMLGAILLWFTAYWGIRPFITLYVIEFLHVSEGIAGISTGMVALSYLLCAVPSGILAHRIGRRKTIRIALVAMAVVAILMWVHQGWVERFGITPVVALATFWVLLFLFGAFWGAANTNSFPMLWQLSAPDTVGAYTGVYYLFSQTAAIITPPFTGFLVDRVGFRAIFLFTSVAMLLSWVVMGPVSGGETARATRV